MIAKLANGKTYTVPKNTILIKIPDKSEGIKQNTEIIFGGPLLTTYKTRADNVNRGCRVLFIPPPPLTLPPESAAVVFIELNLAHSR